MKRSLLALLAGLTLAACTFTPDGTCATTADCNPGQYCTSGICVGCQADADCQAWQACDGQRRCVVAAGRCASDEGCSPWQACDASHACTLRPGACDAGVGCQAWQACSAHACTLPAGNCDGAADCGTSQVCTGDHRCVSGCPTGSECQAWETCGADQLCALRAGRCNVAGDCAAWQACDATNSCALAAGKCDAGVGCHAWEACDVHDCTLQPSRCNVAGDCAAWEACDATNTCALAPGRCLGGADCAGWETCNASNTCVAQPGRCTTEADCPGWELCSAANVCEPFAATTDKVYYAGFLEADNGQGLNGVEGVASPYAPTRPFLSVPEFGGSRCWIEPGGGILYKAGVWNPTVFEWNYEIRRAVEDQPYWDGAWHVPRDAPDVVLLAVPDLREFVIQEGTGAILHDSGFSDWRDAAGVLHASGVRVMAWSQAGVLLALRYPATPAFVPQLIDAAGLVTPVTGLDLTDQRLLSGRVHGSGFWLLVARANPTVLERWTIAADGAATLDGVYPSDGSTAYLDTLITTQGAAALDGGGAAWALLGPDMIAPSHVYKLELGAAATQVVGDPPPGANRNDVNPFQPFLVTGRNTTNCGIVTGP